MAMYPSERLIERALKLIVQIEVETPSKALIARDTLNAWRTRAPEHEAAVNEAQQRWAMLGGMSEQLRGHFEISSDEKASKHRQNRRALLSLIAIGGTALIAGRTLWDFYMPTRYSTKTAELMTVQLADVGEYGSAGSILDLNALTSIQVMLRESRRSVRLEQGEIRCEVTRNPDRPFFVVTREGVVEVIGTVFSVSDRGGAVSVAVEHGHVRFTPTDSYQKSSGSPIAPIDLRDGEALSIQNGNVTIRQHIDIENIAAWREGWLVFDNTELSEALPAINAYRTTPIYTKDSQINELRVTGRFRARESATLLETLPQILPLQAQAKRDGSVELIAP